MSITNPEGSPTLDLTPGAGGRSGTLVGMSVALGIVVSAALIIGFVGKTLYVTREEYGTHNIQYVQDKTVFQQTLQRVEALMSRQERAFEQLSDTVQTVRIQVAGQRGR